jgi:uncharacterized cupredoxin-like copper-binding protein
MRPVALVALLALLAGLLGGCGGDGDEETLAPRRTTTTGEPVGKATITANEYSFGVDGKLGSGRNSITFDNKGSEIHQVLFARMQAGVTLDQVTEAMRTGSAGGSTTTTGDDDDSDTTERTTRTTASRASRDHAPDHTVFTPTTTTTPPPTTTPTTVRATTTTRRITTTTRRTATTARRTATTARRTATTAGDDDEETTTTVEDDDVFSELFDGDPLGAPGGMIDPGHAQTVVTDELQPGNYAMLCLIPTPDGETHAAKGMVNEIVVEDQDAEPDAPQANERITIEDGELQLEDEAVNAGQVTFEIENLGEGPHEFTIVKPDEDKTLRDLIRYYDDLFDDGEASLDEPPGEIVASLLEFPPGETLLLTTELDAGTYIIACTYEDEEGDQDHKQVSGEQVTIEVGGPGGATGDDGADTSSTTDEDGGSGTSATTRSLSRSTTTTEEP